MRWVCASECRITWKGALVMAAKFLDLTLTDAVRKSQEKYYGRSQYVPHPPGNDALTADEVAFIQARDSFYMATVNEAGWPYIQHRGGLRGFLRVVNPS